MTTLAERPGSDKAERLTEQQVRELSDELGGSWQIVRGHHLEKEFKFKDFREALSFTNRVGEIAEQANHHPDICLSWGKVKLTIWTHSVDGLGEGDFILAAKIDKLPLR